MTKFAIGIILNTIPDKYRGLQCTILNFLRFDNYFQMNLKYSQQDMFDKLNDVCKKYDITSYELDIKLSQSLLDHFTIEEIRNKELIMVALKKLLSI